MFKSSFLVACLSILLLSFVSALQASSFLYKRGVIGLNICLHRNSLEGCIGGDPACCRIFCNSHRVTTETDAAEKYCGTTPTQAPQPAPPPATPPAPLPVVVTPPPVYYTQTPPQVLYPQPVYPVQPGLAPAPLPLSGSPITVNVPAPVPGVAPAPAPAPAPVPPPASSQTH
ncbi:hypothetical protein PCASD_13570 [Puccinia coronata f. sp. avenae]|uniref:Uncharacterized protein n=1 Tax=Puccinia coronata f. sp. avenae TaxID=200324 RepID=A0A2N5TDU7_9BASI|nr:hypothetical protein PCASD_13570 [Puccinia coronata f. sp. avenae]